MYVANSQQGDDLRGGVDGGSAWDLCCRQLHLPEDKTRVVSSAALAQLMVYWIEENQLPSEMGVVLYRGMMEDLQERGKRIETVPDSESMKCRWVRLAIHRELDIARSQHAGDVDAYVDIEVDACMVQGEAPSQTVEAEDAAEDILASLRADRLEWTEATQEATSVPAPDGSDAFALGEATVERGPAQPAPHGSLESTGSTAESRERSAERSVPPTRGHRADKPLVDPPAFAERIRDTDKIPYWIPGAFPTIFQNQTGDPHNYVLKEPDLVTWGPHVMSSKGWAAQAHMTFMYWWMNMIQRMQALSAKNGTFGTTQRPPVIRQRSCRP